MSSRKNRTLMPVKGYYTRAKVFGYAMLVIAVLYLIYTLLQRFLF